MKSSKAQRWAAEFVCDSLLVFGRGEIRNGAFDFDFEG